MIDLPPDHNQPRNQTPEPSETKTETVASQMDYWADKDMDNLTKRQLKKAIRDYANQVADESDILDITLNGVSIELSTKMKRTAGKVAYKRGSKTVNYIRFAWKAYQKWGWDQFADTIRHELIHVHQVQNYGKGGHGGRFRLFAEKLDTHRHCQNFAEDEAKFKIRCDGCGKEDYRYRRSKVVKHPHRYSCNCGGDLEVTDLR